LVDHKILAKMYENHSNFDVLLTIVHCFNLIPWKI